MDPFEQALAALPASAFSPYALEAVDALLAGEDHPLLDSLRMDIDMTWTGSVKINANEAFDANAADAQIQREEKYNNDVLAALEVVDTLDTFDPSKERTVNLSGYRSATTNQVMVSVTGKETPPAGTGG